MSPVTATDMSVRLTVTTGPGDSTAQPDPNASLGEFCSTTAMVLGTANGLFRDVTDGERTAGIILYRSTFWVNEHATDDAVNPVVWLSTEVAGGGSIAIGLDPVGVVAVDSASAQGAESADEETAPAGVTFSAPTTKAGGIAVGENIPAGEGIMIHWRLTVVAGAAPVTLDGVTVSMGPT